jgi:hypothetical protein
LRLQKQQTTLKKSKVTAMKKTTKLTLVRSLVVLGSCLAFSPVAQAVPKFHGNLTINFSGMTMFMGMGGDLGSSSMVMFMTMMGMGGDTVTHSDGDFAVLGVKRGNLVNGPMMIMEGMSMGAMVSIPSVPGWSWMESDMGPTFSSAGPDNLQITITGMTSGGGYAPAEAMLTLEFFMDENGMLQNSITLIAAPPGH